MTSISWVRRLCGLLLCLPLCGWAGQGPLPLGATSGEPPRPPVAEQQRFIVKSPHGDRVDEYHWLRDDDPKTKRPAILSHLEAENAYTRAMLAPLQPLRDRLVAEMRSRIADRDSSAAVYGHGWWTWQRWEPGAEHATHLRRRGGPDGPDPLAADEVLLDEVERARGQAYYQVGSMAVSPNGRWLAWTEDITGRNIYTLRFRDLVSGVTLPHHIDGVTDALAWADDRGTLLYVRQDPVTLQGTSVWRHRLGGSGRDVKVFAERDVTLSVSLQRSASGRFVLVRLDGYHTSETRAVSSQRPGDNPRMVLKRRPGVLHTADHLDGRWVIRTNENAPNYRLVEAPESAPERRSAWKTLVTERPKAMVESFALLHGAVVLQERVDVDSRVRLLPVGRSGWPAWSMGEPATSTTLGELRDPAASYVPVHATSMIAPWATWAVRADTGERFLRKQQTVHGFDAALYRTQRVWARSHDGVQVPVTLAWRADRAGPDRRAPLLIDGYGAYGASNDPWFSSARVSLLDRGFVLALAHVRGGSELGTAWYEAGRLLNKKNSFHDFIAVADHLVAAGWGAPDKVFATGGSAGGLLMGVVANWAGSRFRGIAMHVPFVDAVTTMLDASIPLTANEWSQWGDPRRAADHAYLLSYSPYDRISAQPYPAMLVTTGLWDGQVQYYEPAKYVARLRATKTDTQPLLFHIDLQAGHGGRAGRFEQLDDAAREMVFFLALAGIRD